MPYWPPHLPRTLAPASITLSQGLDLAAARDPSRTAIAFFGTEIGYRRLLAEANAVAGWLRVRAGVKRGGRVILYLQNSPQWAIAYYGILRADAVVVPVNPMNRAAELRRLVEDSGAEVVVCSQELAENVIAAAPNGLREIVVAAYSDYLPTRAEFSLPDWIAEPRRSVSGCVPWVEILDRPQEAPAREASAEDLAVLVYTSGSSGEPKGCRHTHRSLLHATVGLNLWHGHTSETVFLGVAPMYQIAGLVSGLNCAIHAGGKLVAMPRWEPALAAELIRRNRVTFAGIAPAALADLLASPDFSTYDLSSLRRIGSGGSTMPKSLWQRLLDVLGLPFIEVYGMSETGTIALNPIERPKPQCLGVPFFDADVRIVDPATGAGSSPGEPGEFVVRGPQLFQGYWHPRDDAAAFLEVESSRYFRTGDVGYADPEGYLFMTDRLKRMINAAGFKVWPAEVEAVLLQHPGVAEACVIGSGDPRRGETVKALVVPRQDGAGRISESGLIAWARERMAAYKVPRVVQFVETLPKSATGKILWRALQDAENRSSGDR